MGSNPRALIPDNVLTKIAVCDNGTMLFKSDGFPQRVTKNYKS